jgi:hypothetical protein
LRCSGRGGGTQLSHENEELKVDPRSLDLIVFEVVDDADRHAEGLAGRRDAREPADMLADHVALRQSLPVVKGGVLDLGGRLKGDVMGAAPSCPARSAWRRSREPLAPKPVAK